MARRSRAVVGSAMVSTDMGMMGLMACLVSGLIAMWTGGLQHTVVDASLAHDGHVDAALVVPTPAVRPVIAWVTDGLEVLLESDCRDARDRPDGCPDPLPDLRARVACLGDCAVGGPDLAQLQALLLDARDAFPSGTEAWLVPSDRSDVRELIAVMDAVREVDAGDGTMTSLFPDVSVVAGAR